MRILVTGAAGMVGRKLVERLARDGTLGGEPITRLSLADVVPASNSLLQAPGPSSLAVETTTADLADPGAASSLVEDRPEVVFHLAAVVSGEAEANLEKGYRVNLDGTRALFDAIRVVPDYRPRVVFTSSIAVLGAPFPDVIGDDYTPHPLTSYGTQKAMCELLLDDYSRRDLLDGIGIRLPTICVRPGTPNKAASGFFSGIIREPLVGQEAILPVPDDIRHWHASPRSAVGFLLHGATLDTAALGQRRCLTMPGVSATVADQIEALRVVAGDAATRLIRREPDEAVMRIVETWPGNFDPRRARDLGFEAESSFEEIVRIHVEDELGGTIPVAAA